MVSTWEAIARQGRAHNVARGLVLRRAIAIGGTLRIKESAAEGASSLEVQYRCYMSVPASAYARLDTMACLDYLYLHCSICNNGHSRARLTDALPGRAASK